ERRLHRPDDPVLEDHAGRNLPRGFAMLDHVGLNVRDYPASRRFYEQALDPLGYHLVMGFDEWKAAGFGEDDKPFFWVVQREPVGPATHVAFVARDRPTSTPSTQRRSPPAERTTARPASARTTTRRTTRRSSSIRTATTSRRCATPRRRLQAVRDLLSDEQREIRELVRTLARERIAPRAADIDKSAEFPWDIVEVFREHELFGILVDPEYGGLGASALMTFVAVEEIAKVCATSSLVLAVQELGVLGLKLVGTDEQKQRFLPRMASGEWLGAYALTEPGSRSGSAAILTTARRGGGEERLNRRQPVISHARVRT